MGSIVPIIILSIFVLILLAASVRVVNEYERGVVFRLGRYVGVGSGLFADTFISAWSKSAARGDYGRAATECITWTP
jgi:hypothetical protein